MEYAIKKSDNYESVEFFSPIVQTEGKSSIYLLCKIADAPYSCIKTITRANQITDTGYKNGMDFKLTSTMPFSYTYPFLEIKYFDKKKVEDFLYEISYGRIDYDYAYANLVNPSLGGCSAIRNGNYFGRNFDWKYDNEVLFIVHTPSAIDRFGVLGVSGIVPGMDKTHVDLDSVTVDGVDMFKLLPFYLLDGINEKGLFATMNVVPLDDPDDPTTEVQAKIEEKDKVNAIMLVRFILDKFSCADRAIDYLLNYTTVYFSDEIIEDNYQLHLMIGDEKATYIVEFINNEFHVIPANYITNFQIKDVLFDNGKVPHPAIPAGMNPYGSGLERYDIIVDGYSTACTLDGMKNLLDEIKYSNGYTWDEDLFWYSEIVGMLEDSEQAKINVDTPYTECSVAMADTMVEWDLKDRSTAKVWITCHSSIYDIKCRKLYIRNQEGETEYVYSL